MKTATLAMTLTGALIAAPLALAGGGQAPLIDKRQQQQVQRLKNGVKSGALTGKETSRLAAQQAWIRHKEQQFKADGQLSVKERLKLHRGLNRSSRRLQRQKHDAQTR